MALLVATFAVFALGQRIPLPGLDREMLELQAGGSPDILSRVSILALGIMPMLTAFGLARIVGLLLPLDRWRSSAPHAVGWLRIGAILVALGLTVLQGYGILVAIDQSGLVAAPAGWFTAAGLACFVGSTACLIWLAERSWPLGIWLLVCVPFLTILPSELAVWNELWRMGVLQPVDALVPALYLVGATASIVLCHAALLQIAPAGEEGEAAAVEVLVWPPFLSGVAGTLLFMPLPLLFPAFGEDALMLDIARIAILAIFVPLFVRLYARRLWRAHPAADASARRSIVLLVIAVQLAVCLLGEWLLRAAAGPAGLSGAPLIAVVVTMLVIGRSLGLPARFDPPKQEARA